MKLSCSGSTILLNALKLLGPIAFAVGVFTLELFFDPLAAISILSALD